MPSPMQSSFDLLSSDVLLPMPPSPKEAMADDSKPDEPVPAGPRTGRDIQRGALRDLISLAAECAATESDVEREYRTGKEKQAKSYGERNFAIDQGHKQQLQETNQKHKARLAELEGQYKAGRNKIAAADKAAKKKVDDEKAGVDEKVKAKYDQAVWLADSVLEAANSKAAIEFKEKSEAIGAAQQELDGVEIHAAKLVQRYGVSLPTNAVTANRIPPSPPTPMPPTSRTALRWSNCWAGSTGCPSPTFSSAAGRTSLDLSSRCSPGCAVMWYNHTLDFQEMLTPLAIFAGGMAGLAIVAGIALRIVATRQVRAVYEPLRLQLLVTRQAVDQQLINASKKREKDLQDAAGSRQ